MKNCRFSPFVALLLGIIFVDQFTKHLALSRGIGQEWALFGGSVKVLTVMSVRDVWSGHSGPMWIVLSLLASSVLLLLVALIVGFLAALLLWPFRGIGRQAGWPSKDIIFAFAMLASNASCHLLRQGVAEFIVGLERGEAYTTVLPATNVATISLLVANVFIWWKLGFVIRNKWLLRASSQRNEQEKP